MVYSKSLWITYYIYVGYRNLSLNIIYLLYKSILYILDIHNVWCLCGSGRDASDARLEALPTDTAVSGYAGNRVAELDAVQRTQLEEVQRNLDRMLEQLRGLLSVGRQEHILLSLGLEDSSM